MSNALIRNIIFNLPEFGISTIEPVTPGYITVSSGAYMYRKGLRDGMYVMDYSNNNGVTWELDLIVLYADEDSIIIDVDTNANYRQQVRDTNNYCIDEVLTPLGFAGLENTDWQNIYRFIPAS